MDRTQHIVDHGLGQLGAGSLVQHFGQPLLGISQILYGNQDHGLSVADRALCCFTAARTEFARFAWSSDQRMMVFVQWTRSPDWRSDSAAWESRLSTTSMSRKSW